MTANVHKPLVWIIDSPRTPLAEFVYLFEEMSECRYYPYDHPLPLDLELPDAVFFSAEIEGGADGKAFAELSRNLEGVPLLAAAKVRSLAQAVAFFRKGIVDYLSLPLDPEEVAERLEAALARGSGILAPAVMVELEALDNADDAEKIVLKLEETGGAGDDLDGDILAQLSEREAVVQEIAETADQEADADEPEPVDGLPIPSMWEELPCGLLVFDSQGNLVFANGLGLELFGFATLAELQDALDNNRTAFAAFGANKKALPDNQWPHTAAIRARAARHGFVSIERPDKRRVWLRMDCLPHLSDGAITRVTMTLVNVTGEIPALPAVFAKKPK